MKLNNHNNSAITGKRGEYQVIGKLMQEGFIVYTPILDIGVDCIIKNDKGRLIEIQIKTRNKGTDLKMKKQFIIKKQLKCDVNFFICCYFIDTGEIWFIPSYKFKQLSKIENGFTILTMDLETEKDLLSYKDERGIGLLKHEEPHYEQKK